jgi:hypothetical protein
MPHSGAFFHPLWKMPWNYFANVNWFLATDLASIDSPIENLECINAFGFLPLDLIGDAG